MKFEDVLPALRRGEKVRRLGWPHGWPWPGETYHGSVAHLIDDLTADDWEVVSEHAPCWNCGAPMESEISAMRPGHHLICALRCGVASPWCNTEAEAWRLWDAHALRG